MKIYKDINSFRGVNYPVVTVGTFDGLHVGHQKIIEQMNEIAREKQGETVLVTFEPHPRQVLNSNHFKIKFITSQQRKEKLLDQFGIDHMIVIRFTKEFSRTPSDVFIKDYLVDKIRAKKLIVGYDHHFGRNREGNYEKLNELGQQLGFGVEEIPAQYIDGIPVSSTKIRNALNEGDVTTANKMLGYEYSITGKVVDGNKVGRSLGFPTANIDIADEFKLIAAGGVYACRVGKGDKMYQGMGNIGTRPTIGLDGLVTEVHIFDFEREIYGEEITIYFVERIRDEVKFANLDLLKKQLVKDRETTLKILGSQP